MNGRTARWLVLAWGAAYVVFLSWPGLVPFNRIEPKILGMPFVMAFVASWLVLGFIVLILLDRVVTREEDDEEDDTDPSRDSVAAPARH